MDNKQVTAREMERIYEIKLKISVKNVIKHHHISALQQLNLDILRVLTFIIRVIKLLFQFILFIVFIIISH